MTGNDLIAETHDLTKIYGDGEEIRALDGVSLTINQLLSDHFQVSIIPHTAMLTTIGHKRVGQACNIETDLIGKYVERFVNSGEASKKEGTDGVDLDLLAKSGFLDS